MGIIVATAIRDLSYGGESSNKKCSLSLKVLHKRSEFKLVLYSVAI
jgi:hypothetical protein